MIVIKMRTDITGLRFGKLLVVSFSHRVKNWQSMWNCICECGKKAIVNGRALKTGNTKSCGCLHTKLNGLWGSNTHVTWDTMIRRCYNPKHISYKYYGALGINVCDRWRETFINFYDDMGARPEGMTLDRIDSKGNYCKENCRWATMKQQQRNRSSNHIIEAFGKRQTIIEWAEETGLSKSNIISRLKSKWPIQEVLNKKLRQPGSLRDEKGKYTKNWILETKGSE